jgi:hypothetical protein
MRQIFFNEFEFPWDGTSGGRIGCGVLRADGDADSFACERLRGAKNKCEQENFHKE